MAKKKKRQGRVIQMLSPENYIKQKARSLPIGECIISSCWEEAGLASILVARTHTNGNFTVGMYLVDLKCLGVKYSEFLFNISAVEYSNLKEEMMGEFEVEKVDYKLVHNIVYAGFEYADDYGFSPHKKFAVSRYILEEDSEDIELMDIHCGGDDGKPLYVQGEYDDEIFANSVRGQLEKTAGPGNYNFIKEVEFDESDSDSGVEDMSLSEKIFLDYLAYFEREEELDDYEYEHMLDLSDILFCKLLEDDKELEILDELENRIDAFDISDGIFDEMLADTDIPVKQYSQFKKGYNEIMQLIRDPENIGEAEEKFDGMRGDYPENELLCGLALSIIRGKDMDDYPELLKKSTEKYPENALISLLDKINFIEANTVGLNNEFEFDFDYTNIFERLFPERQTLYVVEIYYVVLYLLYQSINTLNLSLINALSILIYDIDLWEEHVDTIERITVLSKKAFVDACVCEISGKDNDYGVTEQ